MAEARTLVAGTAEGPALVLDEPLSLWGGLDPVTGEIVDVRHPQRGANVARTSGHNSHAHGTFVEVGTRIGR